MSTVSFMYIIFVKVCHCKHDESGFLVYFYILRWSTFRWSYVLLSSEPFKILYTVKSLLFMGYQFSWFLWVD